MQLIQILAVPDVAAALQAWVAGTGHQMDMTVKPVFYQDGTIQVALNS